MDEEISGPFHCRWRLYDTRRYLKMEKEVKQQIIAENKIHDTDTGSPEVQIAILTNRINHLNEHLKVNKNDLFFDQPF